MSLNESHIFFKPLDLYRNGSKFCFPLEVHAIKLVVVTLTIWFKDDMYLSLCIKYTLWNNTFMQIIRIKDSKKQSNLNQCSTQIYTVGRL